MLLTTLAPVTPAPADELDHLLAKADPPARFKDHKPNWSIKERTYTYQEFEGPLSCLWYLVYDGDICVAGIPTQMFQSGHVYIYDFRPGQGVKEPPMPTERFHIETERGMGIRTDAFIPESAGGNKETYDFKIVDGKVILTRKWSGTSTFNKWSHRSKEPVKVEACNVAVLSAHPQLGYNVDIHFDAWCSQNMTRTMYMEAGPGGRHSPWPDEFLWHRVAISRVGREGFEGYATNMGATLQHGSDFLCRDGGIMAFLNADTGWSTCYTNNSGVESKLTVCGPHTDLDVTLDMTKVLKEKKDGMNHYVVRHRMVGLPPEMTRHVWDSMNLLHKGERRLLLKLGRVDDFEDQPVDICGRERGVTLNGKSEVSTEFAHSGKKSLKFTNETLRNGNPTICIRPDRKYRLEAWVKVVGDGQAYMTLAFAKYDMDKPVSDTMKSNVAKAGDWQKIVLDFDSPKWGPSLRLGLVAENCTVYLDDFQLAPIQ
jgi:hypothetical protein